MALHRYTGGRCYDSSCQKVVAAPFLKHVQMALKQNQVPSEWLVCEYLNRI